MDSISSRKRIRDLEIDTLSRKVEYEKLKSSHAAEILRMRELMNVQEKLLRDVENERRMVLERYEHSKSALDSVEKELTMFKSIHNEVKIKMLKELATVQDELSKLRNSERSEISDMKLKLQNCNILHEKSAKIIVYLEEQVETISKELSIERQKRADLSSIDHSYISDVTKKQSSDENLFIRKQLSDYINKVRQLEEQNRILKNDNLRYQALYQNNEMLREENLSLQGKTKQLEIIKNENIKLHLKIDELQKSKSHQITNSKKEHDLEFELSRLISKQKENELLLISRNDDNEKLRMQLSDINSELENIRMELANTMLLVKNKEKQIELLQFQRKSMEDQLASFEKEREFLVKEESRNTTDSLPMNSDVIVLD